VGLDRKIMPLARGINGGERKETEGRKKEETSICRGFQILEAEKKWVGGRHPAEALSQGHLIRLEGVGEKRK